MEQVFPTPSAWVGRGNTSPSSNATPDIIHTTEALNTPAWERITAPSFSSEGKAASSNEIRPKSEIKGPKSKNQEQNDENLPNRKKRAVSPRLGPDAASINCVNDVLMAVTKRGPSTLRNAMKDIIGGDESVATEAEALMRAVEWAVEVASPTARQNVFLALQHGIRKAPESVRGPALRVLAASIPKTVNL